MTYAAAYVTDDEFFIPTLVSIHSLKAHMSDGSSFRVHVLCRNIATDKLELLRKEDSDGFSVIVHQINGDSLKDVEDKIGIMYIANHVSKTALYKMLLPELIGEEKILYIDGDTLVMSNLDELFDTDMGNNLVLAVRDYHAYDLKTHKYGYDPRCYFNSGVMMLNLKKMREEQTSRKMIQHRSNNACEYMDQDSFNAICKTRVKTIDIRYNYSIAMVYPYSSDDMKAIYGVSPDADMDEFLSNVSIFHFAGEWKPWKYYNVFGSVLWEHYSKGIVPRKYRRYRTYYDAFDNKIKLNYPSEKQLTKKRSDR